MPRAAQRLIVSVRVREALDAVLSSGVQQACVILRALAIRHLADGASAAEAAKMVRLTPKAVRAIARRYRQGGLDRELRDRVCVQSLFVGLVRARGMSSPSRPFLAPERGICSSSGRACSLPFLGLSPTDC